MRVGIINYGLGNTSAFKHAFKKLNCEASIISNPDDINLCSHLILPGVGAFDYAIELLKSSSMFDVIKRNVLFDKKPILGVCVGMQILFEKSEEGNSYGLGWIKGNVKRLPSGRDNPVKLPHIGWNSLENINKKNTLCFNLENDEFYFLHSYHCVPEDKNLIISNTVYGESFCSSIQFENIIGCQFHPEKSHDAGLGIFSNFLRMD